MKYHLIFLSLMVIVLLAFQATFEVISDRQEALHAFKYLNEIRSAPDSYFQELKYEKGLQVSKVKLKWNDTIALVAEARALDMATKDYFSHTGSNGFGVNYLLSKAGYTLKPEWIRDRKANFFESIAGDAEDGKEMIRILIIDENTPNLGHRKHLLGIGNWDSTLTDIGIGFATRTEKDDVKTFASVIIAKHK